MENMIESKTTNEIETENANGPDSEHRIGDRMWEAQFNPTVTVTKLLASTSIKKIYERCPSSRSICICIAFG